MMPDSSLLTDLRQDAAAIWSSGMEAAQPATRLDASFIARIESKLIRVPGRCLLVGCGKAAWAMSCAFVSACREAGGLFSPESITGLVTVPRGYENSLPARYDRPRSIDVVNGGHPLPDASSVAAVNQTEGFLRASRPGPDDVVVVMVSGGGSANWGAPTQGFSPDIVRNITQFALTTSVDIRQLNAARRLVTRFGNGGLLDVAGDATVVTIVLSDVPTDDLSVVASGPTLPVEPPGSVAELLERLGLDSEAIAAGETNADRSRRLARQFRGRNHVFKLADSNTSTHAAANHAAQLGYEVLPIQSLSGEARLAGKAIVDAALRKAGKKRCAIVAGGETTVRVNGDGLGGRNQEVALGAANALSESGRPAVILCAGTDGVDGPTDAAGGFADSTTIDALRKHDLTPTAVLDNNDSYSALRLLNALFTTGPTHTNVMDLSVLLLG